MEAGEGGVGAAVAGAESKFAMAVAKSRFTSHDNLTELGEECRKMCAWIPDPPQRLDERMQMKILENERARIARLVASDITWDEGLREFANHIDSQLVDANTFERQYYQLETAADRIEQARLFQGCLPITHGDLALENVAILAQPRTVHATQHADAASEQSATQR